MDAFRIRGGVPLHGTVAVAGAKNAALPIMAAAILADGPILLGGVPELTDVETLSRLLRRLGLTLERDATGRLRIETVNPKPVRASYDLVRRMRATFCVLGPLLARRGRAVVALPGGCRIGQRPVDLHLAGLAALGAEIRVRRGYVIAQAKRLRGARVSLAGPGGTTVTGTANVLAAAVLAQGETILTGAAREPEIVDLGRFLIALGARIEGLGTPTLRIAGVEQLGGCEHQIIPDRIEAATLLLAGAITGGSVQVNGAVPAHLTALLDLLDAAGARIELGGDSIKLAAPRRLRPIRVTARPYPGVPTDLQAQLTALATVADGTSRVTDRVFPERFAHLAELSRLGAAIDCRGGCARIRGVTQLQGAELTAADLRGGAALVLAGLAAEGTTVVRRIHHLDRGYERLEQKLQQLGAHLARSGSRETSDARLVRNSHEFRYLLLGHKTWPHAAAGHPCENRGGPLF